MGRKSSLDEQDVFRCVAHEFSEQGRLGVEALCAATGLSMGSIYHRFGSREGLMAEAWLNAVQRFQSGFLKALEPRTIDAGIEAALATPRFCRAYRDEAILLACCRQNEFVQPSTPAQLRARIEAVNDTVSQSVREFARSVGLPLIACRLALIAYPLGAVRLYLPSRAVPNSLDGELRKAVGAALERDR
jgi:AcrR family transcriptional regulator